MALKTAVNMTLNSAFPTAIAWGPDLTLIYNDGYRLLLGDQGDAMGHPLAEVWAQAWDILGPVAEAARTGTASFEEDLALMMARNGAPEEAFFTFGYSPLADDDGGIGGIVHTVVETTARVTAERQFRLMNSELHHRMKNMFATVSSIVSQTLRLERPVAEVRPLLLQRINTIANAQSLLLDENRGDLPLQQVLEAALSPHNIDRNRVRLQGSASIELNEKRSLSLSLALNELVTNAIHYGALSNESGYVVIAWEEEQEGGFQLTWQEVGGPPVQAPGRRGFGTTLVERIAPHDFGGTGELTYEADGLRYELRTNRL